MNAFARTCSPQATGSYLTYTCYRPNGRPAHYHGKEDAGNAAGYLYPCHHRHTTGSAAYACSERRKMALEHSTLVILATFGSDYHDGQASRLYRLQCRARAIIAQRYTYDDWTHNIPERHIKSARRTKLYRELVAKYGQS